MKLSDEENALVAIARAGILFSFLGFAQTQYGAL